MMQIEALRHLKMEKSDYKKKGELKLCQKIL